MKIISIALFLALLFVAPADAAGNLTQRDWLINLTSGMGWDFGLPDEPGDADYLRIMDGDRQLEFEAENLIQPTDMVSRKRLRNFGEFSGEAWVSGVSGTSYAHLQFLLPIGGPYQIRARLLGKGHTFAVGSQSLTADGDDKFADVIVGELQLLAGQQEFVVAIPPGGGIDTLSLYAPALVPIEPAGGWQLDQPLQWNDLAVTSLQLLDLLDWFPTGGSPVVVEAETAVAGQKVEFTDVDYFGTPSSGRWIRAGADTTECDLVIDLPTAGVFRLSARALGGEPIAMRLDGRIDFRPRFDQSFVDRDLGTVPLAAGPHTLTVTLPGRSGLDKIELIPLRFSPELSLALAGLEQRPGVPNGIDLDRLIGLLRLFSAER